MVNSQWSMVNDQCSKHVLVEELFNACEEVLSCVSSADTVISVGVELHFELGSLLDELLNEFGGVLEMHVVIGHTMA